MKSKHVVNKTVIIGTGAFGTAMANAIVENTEKIFIYGIDQAEIKDINKNHKNSKYFGSKKINSSIVATNDKSIFNDTDVIIIATPSDVVRSSLSNDVLPNMTQPAYFVNLSKGFDYLNEKTLAEVIEDVIPEEKRFGVLKLSGPSFASEVIKGEPTAFVLAARDKEVADKIAPLFRTNQFSIETSNQLLAVEAISIVKNSLAILMGVVEGLGYKKNTQALFFTDALNEMKTCLRVFGAEPEFALTAAGVGDLFLTGSSKKSRNYATGYAIGKADKVSKKILSTFKTVEGLRSIEIILKLADKHNIELKLFNLLYNLTYNNKKPSETVDEYLINKNK